MSKKDFITIKIPLKYWKQFLIIIVVIILVFRISPEKAIELLKLFN